MGSLNRDERRTLRDVQAHLQASRLREQVVTEQLGTVDVYFHKSNPAPHLNCATPHKGVAWVRREDLVSAFGGLEHLGRIPRLVFLDALFPAAFRQQIEMMGLTLEDERAAMVFQPLYGPALADEDLFGTLPGGISSPINATMVTAQADLATWLRVFRAAYYNTESVRIEPREVEPLVNAAAGGNLVYLLASYEHTPLGVARLVVTPPSAEIEVMSVAPLWHGMGLEIALVTSAVKTALERGCNTVFTIAPPEEFTQLYRRLGFVDLTHQLTFWRIEDREKAERIAKEAQGDSAR
jgi:GNAT superfamily N-acetyltransferase